MRIYFAANTPEAFEGDALGRLAFEAYSKRAGGLTHDGKPIPAWADVGSEVRARWCAAVHAVADCLGIQTKTIEDPDQGRLFSERVNEDGESVRHAKNERIKSIEGAIHSAVMYRAITYCPACGGSGSHTDACPHPEGGAVSPYAIEDVEAAGGYSVIYADPAWPYRNSGGNGAAENHYPTMPLAAMHKLPIARLAAPDALLFVWGTWPNLPECLALIDAWGFTYKTLAFAWVKTRGEKFHFGNGRYTRANTEPCFLAVRGRGIDLVKSHSVRQLIADEGPAEALVAPLGRHSAKPPEARNRIVELVGADTPRIELFARERVDGWDLWGNEVDSDVIL